MTGREAGDLHRRLVNAHAALRQREDELADALAALRALCRASGDESFDESQAMWAAADLVCALHDETEVEPVVPLGALDHRGAP